MAETGVTIMRMVPALDAGPMLHVLRTPIFPDTTYGELHDQLAEMGALAIVQALALIEVGVRGRCRRTTRRPRMRQDRSPHGAARLRAAGRPGGARDARLRSASRRHATLRGRT
jgi:methionyl-tRNA formyltransferase